jgi:prepilin peptidase CpaA
MRSFESTVFEHPLLLVFPAVMAFAAASDLLTMTIPNRVSLLLVAGFLLLAPFAGLTWPAVLANHFAAGGLVLLVGIGMFAMGWLGGGDAKILAAAALWLGLDHLLPFLTQTAVFGGLLAVAILAYRRFPAAAMRLPDWALRLHKPGGGIPYGVAIGAAALAVYPATPWFAAFAS